MRISDNVFLIQKMPSIFVKRDVAQNVEAREEIGSGATSPNTYVSTEIEEKIGK